MQRKYKVGVKVSNDTDLETCTNLGSVILSHTVPYLYVYMFIHINEQMRERGPVDEDNMTNPMP